MKRSKTTIFLPGDTRRTTSELPGVGDLFLAKGKSWETFYSLIWTAKPFLFNIN